MVNKGIYRNYIKRPMDILLSLLAIIVLSPLLSIISILVRINLGSPIIFKQERPGLNEKIFRIYKFRTMNDKKDEDGNLLPDSERLTKFGRFLRSTSIDELPELFNILKGDMSVIGPRPLLVQYLPLYNEKQRRRHEVKPGLSGLAQVNGRNAITWEDKFDLDVEYIDKISFINDWKIIFKSIKKAFTREDINSGTAATMEEFKGYIMNDKIEKSNIHDILIIIGASGHGKVVADIAYKMKKWDRIEFLDDDDSLTHCLDYEVIGKVEDVEKYKEEADFFVAIGNNAIRENIQEKLIKHGLEVVSLIHPSVVLGTGVEIGIGTAVMAGTIINSSTKIGKGCIINTSSSLDHDNIIEDYVHISPGVRTAGSVNIGKGTWLGIGSVVSNNANICSGCIVGTGAAVVKDITEPGTYVGVPVRKID